MIGAEELPLNLGDGWGQAAPGERLLAALHESVPGPKRRFAPAQRMSAMEGKPDGRRPRPEPALLTRSGPDHGQQRWAGHSALNGYFSAI